MKHKFYVLLVLLISGLFAGCSSDDDGITPPDEKIHSMMPWSHRKLIVWMGVFCLLLCCVP